MSDSAATHNAEIWATRIQRELLALTTDNADVNSTDEVRSMIPNFVRVKDHQLDIDKGTCFIHFILDLPDGVEIELSADASYHQPGSGNGSPKAAPTSYPFGPPIIRLVSGAQHFADGSSAVNNCRLAMDLDWTPSLHLSDAIRNVALCMKESLGQGEPFHGVQEEDISPTLLGARRLANTLTKTLLGGATEADMKGRKGKKKGSSSKVGAKKPNVNVTPQIGDELNLLEEPWVEARGMYACKAIRRPPFVADAIDKAAQQEEQKAFTNPGAMLRSFTKSARSVLEESFLMITDTHILELKASKLQLSSGTVVFCIPIDLMAKLKFRRHESLSLFFKPAPDDPLIYMCPDSGDAVHQIQSVLKRHGVRGKHTNAAAYRAINQAMQVVQEIQTKELALQHDPTVERVNEIMDLYRQAAERFEAAGDVRHAEVVTHLRKFLALPLTVSILDGSFQPKTSRTPLPKPRKDGEVPEGEVLERPPDDSLLLGSPDEEKASDEAFSKTMDNLLREAEKDLSFPADGSSRTADTVDSLDDRALADVAADLDNMMRETDQELAELLKS